MFQPVNKNLSRETFSSREGLTLDPEQGIQHDRLALLGEPLLGERPDLNWETVPTWFKESVFRPVPDATAPTSDWSYSGGNTFPFHSDRNVRNTIIRFGRSLPWFGGLNGWTNAFSTSPFIPECGAKDPPTLRIPEPPPPYFDRSSGEQFYLNLEAVLGGISYIYQDATHPYETWWNTEASNAQGYTLEFRGVPLAGRCAVILDDGTRRLKLSLDKTGLFYMATSDAPDGGTRVMSFPAAFGEGYRERAFRIAVLGNNYFVLDESGLSYTGQNMEPSTSKKFIVGHTSDTAGTILLRSVKAVFDGVYLDTDDDISYIRDTDEHVSYTGSVHHTRAVQSFDLATIKSVSPFGGGTLKVQAQYRNTSNPNWTDLGSPTTITQETETINLSAIVVDSDGSDEVRFKITQQAGSTTTKPAPVEEILVSTTFEPGLTLDPNYGPPEGGNVVRILSSTPLFDTSDVVLVDGVQVPPGNVDVISSSELNVTWPAGSPGVTVAVEVDTPSAYFGSSGYKYVSAYDRGIDRYGLLAEAHGMKSPFQIKNKVPDGDVNLAYLAGRGVEPLANSSLVDLSHLESGNVVGGTPEPVFFGGAATSDAGGSRTFAYASGPSTEEVEVAGSAAGWRELGVPAPLYYKYLVGRGRYYIRHEQIPLSVENLRDSLMVHTKDGRRVNLEEYPWDVIVGTSDVDGSQLPDKTYGVILLTGRRNLPGQTVFVTGTFVDRADKWKLLQGRTEVINPEPIVLVGASRQGFDVIPDVDGNNALEIRS